MRICKSFSRSKPSLTIAPEFGKTIEKPLMSMVDLKKIFNGDGPVMVKPLKTIDGNGALEKKHYHPIVLKK